MENRRAEVNAESKRSVDDDADVEDPLLEGNQYESSKVVAMFVVHISITYSTEHVYTLAAESRAETKEEATQPLDHPSRSCVQRIHGQ